ncbi:MAG: diaminopimelate epimerase [Bacteroidales bacterium]
MAIDFCKFHGTGNDFILIDDRLQSLIMDPSLIEKLVRGWCDRHLGIGADGVIFLRDSPEGDFEMVFYNPDGKPGSMCGNGGRCAVAFAERLGMIHEQTSFVAVDGKHRATIEAKNAHLWEISLSLNAPSRPVMEREYFLVNTGSPHLVVFTKNLEKLAVETEGRLIRNSDPYIREGINVNFVEFLDPDTLFVRTFERGVEGETLSCGTGVTAAAIAAAEYQGRKQATAFDIRTPGGELRVSFIHPSPPREAYPEVWLRGPARLVYTGQIPH